MKAKQTDMQLHTFKAAFVAGRQQSNIYASRFIKGLTYIIAWPLIHLAEVTCSSSSLPVPAKLKELRCL